MSDKNYEKRKSSRKYTQHLKKRPRYRQKMVLQDHITASGTTAKLDTSSRSKTDVGKVSRTRTEGDTASRTKVEVEALSGPKTDVDTAYGTKIEVHTAFWKKGINRHNI